MLQAIAPGTRDEALAGVAQTDGRDADAAREELVRRYQPLVHSRAARHLASLPGDRDGLVGVAQVGLLKAVRDFDPDRRRPFAAYAVARVEGELRNWYRDDRYAVHVPRPLHELHMRVRGRRDQLWQQLGRDPTIDELADDMGCAPEAIMEALAVASAERRRTAELAGAVVVAAGLPDVVDLQRALTALPHRDRRLLHDTFWLERSQVELAAELGVTQSSVSRRLRRILDGLRADLAVTAGVASRGATDTGAST